MLTVKPQPSIRPDRSVKANKSVRPQKSVTGFNFIKSLLTRPQRIFLVLGVLLFSFAAQAAEYVQVECTNYYGKTTFKRTFYIDYEYQLDYYKIWASPYDKEFAEKVEFLTSVPSNNKKLNTRAQIRRGYRGGVCKYTYVRTESNNDGNYVQTTRKAQFSINNETAKKLRQVLNSIEKYAVED